MATRKAKKTAARPGATPAVRPRLAPAAPASSRTRDLKLSTGTRVPLDGDLVFLIDALYRDLSARRGFAPAYAEVQREIVSILKQMGPAPTREYFAASLFLNYVTYENEMAERLTEEIAQKARRSSRR